MNNLGTFVALAEGGRLFGLDLQLLLDAAITAVNVFILFILLSYILYNPVKAGICKKVSAYRWSSYHIYYTIPDPIVTTEFLDLFFDQKEDFEVYMRGEDTGKYMDVEQFCSFTDQEVLQLLNQKLNGRSLPELPVQEKKQLLKEMKQHPSVSQRQLARITGIGFNVIRRL